MGRKRTDRSPSRRETPAVRHALEVVLEDVVEGDQTTRADEVVVHLVVLLDPDLGVIPIDEEEVDLATDLAADPLAKGLGMAVTRQRDDAAAALGRRP